MKHLVRITGLVMVVALLGACPEDKAPAAPVDNTPTMSDAEAAVGTWASGQNSITLMSNGSFRWDMPRPCGAPPCPIKTTTGTYQIHGGQLHLNPTEGNTLTMPYRIHWAGKNVRGSFWFRSDAYQGEWTLPYTGR
jgi:hypothetical protein